jgi:hypothetical protein
VFKTQNKGEHKGHGFTDKTKLTRPLLKSRLSWGISALHGNQDFFGLTNSK